MADSKKEYFVVRRCRTKEGYCDQGSIVKMTDADAEPHIESDAIRMPKKSDREAIKQAEKEAKAAGE